MSIGTIIAAVIVIAMVTAAVMSMVKDTKNGKSIQCDGDCKHCSGHCR